MKLRKIILAAFVVLGAISWNTNANAGDSENQVFFRGGFSYLTNSRGNEVFTDVNGASALNNGKSGFSVATGLDLKMLDVPFLGDSDLLGEIFIEYARFSRKTVTQTTSALLGGAATSNVQVSSLNVTVAPKIRFDQWEHVHPFISPVGVSFLVNSPPSNDTTYLDLGLHFAAGVDFQLLDWLSLGVDARYTHGFEFTNTNMSYFSTGMYAGINF